MRYTIPRLFNFTVGRIAYLNFYCDRMLKGLGLEGADVWLEN